MKKNNFLIIEGDNPVNIKYKTLYLLRWKLYYYEFDFSLGWMLSFRLTHASYTVQIYENNLLRRQFIKL